MTFRLIQIDDVLRREHAYLTAEDVCYCMGEYQPRAGYKAGPVNDLIINFKKPVSRRNLPDYKYKGVAIRKVGKLFRDYLSARGKTEYTFVPIPPSKAKDHPDYDDRLVQALNSGEPALDVRELFRARISMRAHHEYDDGERRPTPQELYENLEIDLACLTPPLKSTVVLFDDVLTNGTHFKACQMHLRERFPDTRVIGVFVGRRKLPEVDVTALFEVIAD